MRVSVPFGSRRNFFLDISCSNTHTSQWEVACVLLRPEGFLCSPMNVTIVTWRKVSNIKEIFVALLPLSPGYDPNLNASSFDSNLQSSHATTLIPIDLAW